MSSLDVSVKDEKKGEIKFFYSLPYTIIVTLIVYFIWLFDYGVYGIMFLGILMGVVFALCRDVTPVSVILFELVMVISDINKLVLNVVFVICACLFFVTLIGGFIIHFKRFKPITKKTRYKGFSVALMACGLSIVIGGIGAAAERQPLPALVVVFYGLVVMFSPFAFNDALGGDNPDRLAKNIVYAILASSVLAVMQMFTVLIESGDILGAIASKYEVTTGYAHPNYLGNIFARSIPICIFLASKDKKGACLWLVGAYFLALCILITSCRSALLMGGITGAISLVYFGIKTKRKKAFFLTTAVLVLITLAGAIVFREKLENAFATLFRLGMDSNGRFDLWKIGMERFKKHPIFGVGIDYDIGGRVDKNPTNTPYTPYWYHNTVVQILCSLGVFGTICFLFYFYRQYRAFILVKKPIVKALFFTLITMQLISLLDVEFLTPQDFFHMMIITYGAVCFLKGKEETFIYRIDDKIKYGNRPFVKFDR